MSPFNIFIVHFPVATKRKAGPFCVICEFAMKELENLLQKNSTEVGKDV